MDTWIKLNSSRKGHDSVARIIQYACKIIAAWQLSPRWFAQLEDTLRLNRKILRFGTFVDSLKAAKKSFQSDKQIFIRYLDGLSFLANSGYLFADHVLILNASRLIKVETKRWSRMYNHCWFIFTLAKLCSDLINLTRQVTSSLTLKGVLKGQQQVNMTRLEPVLLNIVKNILNLPLPLSGLGFVKNKSLVGVCGVASSALTMVQILN